LVNSAVRASIFAAVYTALDKVAKVRPRRERVFWVLGLGWRALFALVAIGLPCDRHRQREFRAVFLPRASHGHAISRTVSPVGKNLPMLLGLIGNMATGLGVCG